MELVFCIFATKLRGTNESLTYTLPPGPTNTLNLPVPTSSDIGHRGSLFVLDRPMDLGGRSRASHRLEWRIWTSERQLGPALDK